MEQSTDVYEDFKRSLQENPDFRSPEVWDGILAILIALTIIMGGLTSAITLLQDNISIENLNPVKYMLQLQSSDYQEIDPSDLDFFGTRES